MEENRKSTGNLKKDNVSSSKNCALCEIIRYKIEVRKF
jgi:hypothetical protein